MKHTKELKIGIFVVVILVGSFFVINYLRGKDVFNREIELKGHFDNVEGLVPSAVVQYRGFKAGQVSKVEYCPETDNFEVICAIDKKFRIPADSKMTIFSTSIMGGKGILLETGESADIAKDGDELSVAVQADLVESLAANIGPIMDALDSTLAKLDKTLGAVNNLLGEENRGNITLAIADLKRTMTNVATLTGSLNSRSSDIETFISELGAISIKLASIVEKADGAMDDLGKFAGNLEKSDIEGLVKSITNLSESIQNPDGSMGKFLHDGNIYNSADSLINELNDLISKMKENPKKYMKISVF